MTMSRRTLVALTAAAVPALGLAGAAHAAPPADSPSTTDAAEAVSRARIAADVLMSDYDPDKGWFPSSWWNSAVAVHAVADYMRRTGDRRYLDNLDYTFERNQAPFPAGEMSTDEIYGNFTSRAIDDAGWWGFAWIATYDLTGDQKYLDMAVLIAEFMDEFWDPSTCGGGIWWDEERTYKNAVTNGQWIRLTAELHNRIPGDTAWLERAQEAWDWYLDSGMINEDGLLNDGLHQCENNNDRVYTYNQGLAIGAALEMHRATGDAALLEKARYFADSALVEGALVDDGILVEWTDVLGETTNDNHKQFKGIFLRYFMELAEITGDARYRDFIAAQAASIWENRTIADRLGVRWTGEESEDSPNVADWRTQASALCALLAEVPEGGADRSLSASLTLPSVVVPDEAPASRELELSVGATAGGARRLPVRLEAQVPSGWSVDLPRAIDLEHPRGAGDGEVAEDTLAVTVTVPADAPDGLHEIGVRVSTHAGLEYTARSLVVVAREIAFTGGTEDIPWLWDSGGSGVTDEPGRFADGVSAYIYRFPFPQSTTTAELTVDISNQFVVELSADAESWTEVLREEEPIRDASNRGERTFDLDPYLDGEDKDVFLRVSDAFPEDGWGGQVHRVTAEYSTS